MRPFLVLCVLGVFGCGRPTAAGLEAQGLAAVDSESTSAVDSGLPLLWPVGATRVEATRRGGYPTPYCDTDAGVVEGATYVLTLPDGRLTWSVCTGYAPATRYWSGERTLDAAGLASFDLAMGSLVWADRQVWADVGRTVLLLTTPTGSLRYEDHRQEYGTPSSDAVYVDGVGSVFAELDRLAGVR